MLVRTRSRALAQNPTVRFALFLLGCLLLILTPLVGVLPGPGGIVLFALGMGLILRNSLWAKRRYVHFKRRWPRPGHWADRGLRRASARRRVEMRKARNGPAD